MNERFNPYAIQGEYLRAIGFRAYLETLVEEALTDPIGIRTCPSTRVLEDLNHILMDLNPDIYSYTVWPDGTVDNTPVRSWANEIIGRFNLGSKIPPTSEDLRHSIQYINITLTI